MKVFIIQPMNGRTDCEILKERNEIMRSFKSLGIDVIDSYIEEDGTPVELLGKSLEMMSKADLVYLVKGWDKARGCRIEKQVAEDYGFTIIKGYKD